VHVPQWRLGPRGAAHGADLLVLDLDPGPPATIVECCQVALLLREVLVADGLEPVAKTSGSKGLQVYAALRETSADRTSAYAHELAKRLEAEHPDLVVSRMTKTLRPHKVFRRLVPEQRGQDDGRALLAAGTAPADGLGPLTWDEVASCRAAESSCSPLPDVLARIEKHGDLFAVLNTQSDELR